MMLKKILCLLALLTFVSVSIPSVLAEYPYRYPGEYPEEVAPRHYPGAVIQSNWATTIPKIDGVYDPIPGEWADAAFVDLRAINPQPLEAYGYFKNDAVFLYILIDVVDDTTDDSDDESNINFDTGHDTLLTDGAEDQFLVEGDGDTCHYVFVVDFWYEHCSPFDETEPLHAGLAAVAFSSPSPNSPAVHRIYEFRIPLALIQVSPGETIGFGMGASIWYGIYDYDIAYGNCWPAPPGEFPIEEFGDLILALPPPPVGGVVTPVNKFELLAPWIGLALISSITVAAVIIRKRKQ